MSKNLELGSLHSSFFEAVSKAPRRLLLVDYEGVLAPTSPGFAPFPEICERLQYVLKDRATRLVVISGRPADEVRLALGMTLAPEIWGGDGLERLDCNGHYRCTEVDIPPEALEALAESEIALRRDGLGKFLEVNLASVSVHWRGLSDLDDILDVRAKAHRVFRTIALSLDSLRFLEFQGGAELRLSGTTKRDVLRRLLSSVTVETPVAYVENDRTDSEVFQVLNGRNFTVVVRVSPHVAGTQPHVWPPEELTRFLNDWIRRTQSSF
jgi:trehalose-6-phosphatase